MTPLELALSGKYNRTNYGWEPKGIWEKPPEPFHVPDWWGYKFKEE